MEKEIYFTPKQAALHFNLSFSTIKNYIYAGKLRTLKTPGGHHRIRKNDILAVLGEDIITKSKGHDSYQKTSLCYAMLSVFETFGNTGNAFLTHARNVSKLSCKIAYAVGMNECDIALVEAAGLVHDIGHIGVEKHILLKNGILSSVEYEAIKLHPLIGKRMLDSINGLKVVSDIVMQHHERIDGKGYPNGIKGDDIHMLSRIISIAEAYDSMVSGYYYKDPVFKEAALSELRENSGYQFDGKLTEVLERVI